MAEEKIDGLTAEEWKKLEPRRFTDHNGRAPDGSSTHCFAGVADSAGWHDFRCSNLRKYATPGSNVIEWCGTHSPMAARKRRDRAKAKDAEADRFAKLFRDRDRARRDAMTFLREWNHRTCGALLDVTADERERVRAILDLYDGRGR